MTPWEYQQARQEAKADNTETAGGNNEGDETTPSRDVVRVMVGGRPYCPLLRLESSRTRATESCQQVVAAVLDLPVDTWKNLQVTSVPGGNTNLLYCVSNIRGGVSTELPDKVLVRQFGGAALIDRDMETSIYAELANQGLALEYYGRFANGRLEGWSDSMQALQVSELAVEEISKATARALGKLHGEFKPPSFMEEQAVNNTMLWTQLYNWMDRALRAAFVNRDDMQRIFFMNLPRWQEEVQFVRDNVIPEDAKIGYCHNDVLAANILWNGTSKELQLIDFEYGGINYFSYDIANHFNEFAGGTVGEATPNYANFPSTTLQREFVREYLTTLGQCKKQQDGDTGEVDPPTDEQISELLGEISGFVLANHLVWALWAVNQAASEGCQAFDYLQYAKCRMDRYFQDRQKWEESRA